jgi:hypothetical protein
LLDVLTLPSDGTRPAVVRRQLAQHPSRQ